MKEQIKFITYNGIEGYIELMKHDVEPLNNPECKRIDLLYDGKDIKAVLDYITNLQEEINKLTAESTEWESKYYDLEKLNNANYLSFIDYKSRIDKAIELVKECIDSDDIYEKFLSTGETKELLNILNGDDLDE